MTEQPTTWRSTGISWRGGYPALTLIGSDGRETSRPLALGDTIGLRLAGDRRCVGMWRAEVRSCPFNAEILPDATDPQCSACAGADPGRALARDAVLDPRHFRLYLAWFGPGLFKVGICAAERGHDRLLEQGALAFTWLASGDHAPIRLAEQAVAASGLAVERRRRASKLAAWWQPSTLDERAAELRDAHRRAHRVLGWPDGVRPEPCTPVDHAAVFGVDRLPATAADISSLGEGTVISGRLTAVIGSELALITTDGAVVLCGRRLAGWPLLPSTEPASGYTTTALDVRSNADQQPLF